MVCESGDLLTVPAGTRHWFDMGPEPKFAAIRFFEQADGWIGEFTGDAIGERFPTLDQPVRRVAAIVIDIEGTASPTGSVRENLYDYTRRHLGQWLVDNVGGAADPVIADIANWPATRRRPCRGGGNPLRLAGFRCQGGAVENRPGLGLRRRFSRGPARRLFRDVPAVLAAWRAAGIDLTSTRRVRFVINRIGSPYSRRRARVADQRLVRSGQRWCQAGELLVRDDCQSNRPGPEPDRFSVRPSR